MLEEARELMIKIIELYGFNDEVTIASSILVDKILNKGVEGMATSVADEIYNHINGKVEHIEINYYDNLVNIIRQFNCKTDNNTFTEAIEKDKLDRKIKFDSLILMPSFLKEVSIREKELGVKMAFWSEEEHEKFKTYFLGLHKGKV